ncbi:hypothetical protein DFA_01021 [Cavenderia fasciculata]|uniref:Uncharacterized protein n=1 Tax=Cavenderia fasciculata TaxID=261658 RepID=F4PV30_CACFS|nr:uncharacterized protein DFA_01021 [Cavenderia fasciculata]EGG21146.1 hypothetical protein DFA_01021 [Cavenderia fasciculata]|eukprot:XP_004358996.1 hypothetical protein DFA_01021 [Cavenderia fasciculata]
MKKYIISQVVSDETFRGLCPIVSLDDTVGANVSAAEDPLTSVVPTVKKECDQLAKVAKKALVRFPVLAYVIFDFFEKQTEIAQKYNIKGSTVSRHFRRIIEKRLYARLTTDPIVLQFFDDIRGEMLGSKTKVKVFWPYRRGKKFLLDKWSMTPHDPTKKTDDTLFREEQHITLAEMDKDLKANPPSTNDDDGVCTDLMAIDSSSPTVAAAAFSRVPLKLTIKIPKTKTQTNRAPKVKAPRPPRSSSPRASRSKKSC